jgi:hypothetical protein
MKRPNIFTFAAISAAFLLGFGTRAYTFERHPELVAADRDLHGAANHLERAAREFGGHRARALELVHQAQGEIAAAFAVAP